MDLEQTAIERLRMTSDMSLRLYKQPLVITYSGGKDSDVLLHLAGAAGIPYEVLHSLTTADAPETVWHVRETFRRLELAGVPCDIDKHKQPDGTYMTMWRLIPLKLVPPTRIMRYCCAALKETSGRGRWIATGVRWEESQKRKSRGVMETLHREKSKRLILMNDNDESRMMMENCQLKGTRTINAIIDWQDADIWDYCTAEKISMNPLYACRDKWFLKKWRRTRYDRQGKGNRAGAAVHVYTGRTDRRLRKMPILEDRAADSRAKREAGSGYMDKLRY